MFCWYLIQSKSKSESTARVNLERQGFEVYFPRLLRSVRRAGKACERIVPLFPGYLFVRVGLGRQSLAPIRSSIGVSSIVRFGADYAVVPDRVIHGLRARADAATDLHHLPPAPLTAGVPVRIDVAPFDGLEGVFERAEGSERVVVLMSILGQQSSVRVPSRFVSAIHAGA